MHQILNFKIGGTLQICNANKTKENSIRRRESRNETKVENLHRQKI